MYNLFLDKSELFEAKIDVKGAKVTDSLCRLLLMSEEWNLVFEGEVDRNGYVEIPVKKLKSVLSEGATGRLKLEVVVDDTYFVPWHDQFQVVVGKRVTAEVKSSKKEQIREKVTVGGTVIKSKPASKSKPINISEAVTGIVEKKYPTLRVEAKTKLIKMIESYIINGRKSRK